MIPIRGSLGTEFTRKFYGVGLWSNAARAVKPRIAEIWGRWQSGGVAEYYTVPDLVEMLDLTPGKIHRLIEEQYLAAVRVDGVLSVPVEFLQDGEPLTALRGTLLVLLDAGFSTDEAVDWLLSENDELGERPVDSLLAGRKSAVRRATQALAF